MNRRQFARTTGALITGAMTLHHTALAKSTNFKMGLQLFTIREPMEKDLNGTLNKIAAIGYQDLETYGFNGDALKYYGVKASEFSKMLADRGLTTSSGHYDLFLHLDTPFDTLNRYVDQCIEGAHALKQRYITWPWLTPESRTRDKFKKLADRLNHIGTRVTKAGLGFAYHNHDFEFKEHGGETGYDIIMNQTDPELVKLQIDLYWVMHSSKKSPAQLFSQQPGRFVMWHIKDMHKESRDYTELGNGSIDYRVILPEATRSGMEFYFIEQGGNFAISPMKSVADSAVFFKKNLERYLS